MCKYDITGRLWDRLRPRKPTPDSRPFLCAVVIFTALIGALITGDTLVGGDHTMVSSGLPWVGVANGAFLLLGGLSAWYGLLPRRESSRSWRAESAGHLLMVGGWLAYGFGSWPPNAADLVPWALIFAMAAGSALRAYQLWRQLAIAIGRGRQGD